MRICFLIAFAMFFYFLPVSAETAELNEISVVADLSEPQSTIVSSVDLTNSESAVTISEVLGQQPNVNNASFGEVTSRPDIRGLSGYRVSIMDDHLAANDVSAMSPDHSTTQMAANNVDKVQLLKGAEALKYSASSGGVVRVIDDEPKEGTYADLAANVSTNNNQKVYSADVGSQAGKVQVGISGAYQTAENYTGGRDNEVPNSDYDLYQVEGRLGYVPSDSERLTFTFGQTVKDYGVLSHEGETNTIELEQQNYTLKWHDDNAWGSFERLSADLQYSDYEHAELADGSNEGLFGQKQLQFATEADFFLSDWYTQARFSYINSELKTCHGHAEEGHEEESHEEEGEHHEEEHEHSETACDGFVAARRSVDETNGEELQHSIDDYGYLFREGSPLPDTVTDALMLGWIADKELPLNANYPAVVSFSGNHQFQYIDLNPKNIEQHWLVPESYDSRFYDSRARFANSFSFGLEQPFVGNGLVNASIGYYERLPSVEELYWNGVHHATESYNLGNRNLDKEKSVNFDLDIQKQWRRSLTQLSGFYYHFDDYIYLKVLRNANTSNVVDPFHGLDVWKVEQTDARIWGGSLANTVTLNPHWKFGVQFDLVRRLDGQHKDIARTAPMRLMQELSYSKNGLTASIESVRAFDSRYLAPNESATSGYRLFNAKLGYAFDVSASNQAEVWLAADNLFDAYAENHLSQVKSEAPLLGRNIRAGIKLSF